MNNQEKRGKKPQPKVEVAEGWWDRLVNFCQAENLAKNPERIYGLTTISRRTFGNAKKTNQFTEFIFDTLVEKLGCKNRNELLAILGTRPVSANVWKGTKLSAPLSIRGPKTKSKIRPQRQISKLPLSPPFQSPSKNLDQVKLAAEETRKIKMEQAEWRSAGEMVGTRFAAQHPEYNRLPEKFRWACEDYEDRYEHDQLTEDDDEPIDDSLRGLIEYISREGGNSEPFRNLEKEHGDVCKNWEWWDGFFNAMAKQYEK